MMIQLLQYIIKVFMRWAVVVAQLVERLLPITRSEVRIQSSVKTFTVNCFKKTKKEKEAVNGPFLKRKKIFKR